MRENCTYGSMRGRAFPTGRPALLYTLFVNGYHVTRTGYNDCVMRKAVAEVRPKPYSLLGLGIGVEKYNCQDYAEELRDAYNRLIELESVREECCLK